MTLFSVAVDRASMSIDILGKMTVTLDGHAVTDAPMRELVLSEIIAKMAVEMANRVPPKPEMHWKAQSVNNGHTPEPLLHLMQVIASGRMGRSELDVLRELAPRFVRMLCEGLGYSSVGLRDVVDGNRMTLDMIARAMR